MINRLVSRRSTRVIVLLVSTFLLLTMGGAIIAAPLTVPLLVGIARSRRGATRFVAAAIVALTLAELVWAATYVTVGEHGPWIWLLPALTLVAVPVGFQRATRIPA